MRKPQKKQAYSIIPDGDHVARYCNQQRVIRHPITKEILGVYPQAFELTLKTKETYLSAYWMEFPPIDRDDVDAQFRAAVAALRAKHPNVRSEAAFVRLNVGRVIQTGVGRGLSIRILCRSKPTDLGYSGIYGMPLDNSDSLLLAQLANQCCVEVRGVADLDR